MTPSTLMVHLTAGSSNDDLLRLAASLAERFKVARVIGIAACQPLQLYSEPTAYVPTDLIERDRAEIDKELGETEQKFRSALQGKARVLEWRSSVIYSLLAEYIAEHLRAADVLITVADPGGSLFDTTRRVATADLVMRACAGYATGC